MKAVFLKLKAIRCLFICEEIWDSETYKKVEGKDCDLVVTINASPFEYQKIIQRENLAIELSKKLMHQL